MRQTNKKRLPICSFLIPFYNEGKRVLRVLDVVTKISLPIEIICINDGSTDNAQMLIQKRYENVHIIHNRKNEGKSSAIVKGLQYARSDYIFLLDADLENLNKDELTNAILTIVETPTIDMLILRRRNDPSFAKLFRGDVLVSGERILRKKDLKSVLKNDVVHYEIEPAINYYMMEKKRRVYWYPYSGTNVLKFEKHGLLPGLKKDIMYYRSVLAYRGVRTYLKSVFVFCMDEAEKPVTAGKFDYVTITSLQKNLSKRETTYTKSN